MYTRAQRTWALLLLLIVCITALPSGTPAHAASRETLIAQAVEGAKPQLEIINDRFSLFESALSAVARYAEDPTDALQLAAMEAITDAIVQITALPFASMPLDADTVQQLVDAGMNMADYRALFDYETVNRLDNINSLDFLLFTVQCMPDTADILPYSIDFQIAFQDMVRKVEFHGINGIFCAFAEAPVAELRNTYLPTLTALTADHLPWETDSAAIEAKANALLDDAEADMLAYEQFYWDQFDVYMEAEAEFTDLMASLGYTPDEILAVLDEITELAEEAVAAFESLPAD